MSKDRIKEFNPSQLIEDFASNGMDTSIFESIDETHFRKAPNFLTFVTDPEFLNATILPKQIEMGYKLFAEFCPICSDPDMVDSLYDQDIGTIREKVRMLEHGQCPECGITRFQLVKGGHLNDFNEFAGCLGQRCIPKDSLVFTHRGIIPASEVEVGDILSHGANYECVDSGELECRKLELQFGWTLRGSKNSHVVPALGNEGQIVDTPISDVKVGDLAFVVMPDLWPSLCHSITPPVPGFPYEFKEDLCAFLGLACRDSHIEGGSWYYTNPDRACMDSVRDMLYELFGLHAGTVDGCLKVTSEKFLSWWEQVAGSNRIPDGVFRTTREAAGLFLFYYFGSDWYTDDESDDSFLMYHVEDGVDVLRLRMLLLNAGILTQLRADEEGQRLVSITVSFTDDRLQKLVDRGYIPLQVTSIEDLPAVPMLDFVIPSTNVYCADGVLHHNSGKSKFIGLVSNYVLHRFLCIPNPIRFFNQSAGDILGMSFAGLTEDKVEKNLWGAFKGFLDASPWFQRYHKFLEDKGKELKTELLVSRKSFIHYQHKKILVDYYGSNSRTLRGDTRIFGSIDEIAWMGSGTDAKDSTLMNADASYTSMNNSLATMRMKRIKVFNEKNYDVPPILLANISSPSSSKDKIMRQVKASNTDSNIYGVQLATWLCNPDYTEESLLNQYKSMDPKEFYRDYGADPPIESNPFLSDKSFIEKVCVLEPQSAYSFQELRDVDSLGDRYIYAKLVARTQDTYTPRVLAFDLGSTMNAFGMAVLRLDKESRPILEDGLVLKPRDGHKLNLPRIFDELIVPFCNSFNVRYAFYDRWQSLDQVTRLKEKNIHAEVYSLRYGDMSTVRGMIVNRSTLLPKLRKPLEDYIREWEISSDHFLPGDISAMLGIQLLTVRDLGNRMTKPSEGDDDLFRAYCLGAYKLTDPRIVKEINMFKPSGQQARDSGPIGVGFSRKDGVSVMGTGVGLVSSRGRGSRR